MKFVNRLTHEQVEKFFRYHRIMCPVSWDAGSHCAYVGGTPGNYSIVRFSDKQVKADRFFEISDLDWQVYLKSLFGNDYLEFLEKTELPNDFICKLSTEDVIELLHFYCIYGIRECDPLINGTRRFKVKFEFDGPYHDIVIAPDYFHGNLSLYGVTKQNFDEFMVKRFGDVYSVI